MSKDLLFSFWWITGEKTPAGREVNGRITQHEMRPDALRDVGANVLGSPSPAPNQKPIGMSSIKQVLPAATL